MNNENGKIKEYNDILEMIEEKLYDLENQSYESEWNKFIPGLRELELNEKGELVSFVAECRVKDIQDHKKL